MKRKSYLSGVSVAEGQLDGLHVAQLLGGRVDWLDNGAVGQDLPQVELLLHFHLDLQLERVPPWLDQRPVLQVPRGDHLRTRNELKLGQQLIGHEGYLELVLVYRLVLQPAQQDLHHVVPVRLELQQLAANDFCRKRKFKVLV